MPSDPNHTPSEATTLLYHQPPQSLYDDVPPAYDEINNTIKHESSRNRFWTRFAAVFLVIFLFCSSWASYQYSKSITTRPKPPGTDPIKQPPATTSTSNKHPLPSPPHSSPPSPPSPTNEPSDPPPKPSLPPLPPIDHLPNLPEAPYVPPTSGRVDLCRPWAYSIDTGSQPSVSDNRPVDQLVYTVPSLAPLHIETSAICPSKNGGNEFCNDYDDSHDAITGKLQVVGGDVERPEIRISLQHASETGLDNVAVCLIRKPNVGEGSIGDGDHKWVLGLYIWKDRDTPGKGVLASLSIFVTLPKSHPHSLSTTLNYFTQTIGPTAPTESNTLVFDTLRVHAGERGEVDIHNITAAVIQAKSLTDNIGVGFCRVTRMMHLRSEYGLLGSVITLAHTDNVPPVQVDMQTTYGGVSLRAKLEYSLTGQSTPRFGFALRSEYGLAVGIVTDPQGTQLLRSHQLPPILPIINFNATSRFAIAQAAVPATYHGPVELSSQYAAIVTNDRASQLPGRTVSWDKSGKNIYRGDVHWLGRIEEAGSVHVATEYATARILLLGLKDDDVDRWPDEGDNVFERLFLD